MVGVESSAGPLAGLRVVELAGLGPGPFAALLLAELGADVVRVDRTAGTGIGDATADTLTRSRPNLALDIRRPEGRDVVLRLLDGADVLLEGMRPGVAERLGLGPEPCLARNPRLVYGRMTGWGQEGPLAGRAGHDLNYAALTGALHAVGPAERPRPALNLVADFGGGALYLVMGVLAALHDRARTGLGQVVDAAMVDGAASLMTMVYGLHAAGRWSDSRESNLLDGGAPFYDTYRCADGGFVAVGALEPRFFTALVDGLGVRLEGDQYDESRWAEHRRVIAEAFATRTREEWTARFEATDACVTPVLGLAEAPHHPHLVARGVFRAVPGGHEPRVAPRFSRTPGLEPQSPRRPGQDSADCLRSAGFTDSEIATLVRDGVVLQS